MKKIFYILFIFNCSLLITSAQVSQVWLTKYNGTGNNYDEATSIFVDNQGFIYVAGGSTGSEGTLDFTVIKYDPYGSVVWSQRYNGPGNDDDDAYLVKVDNSGNVYVCGTSWGNTSGFDYCVIKYNSNGVQQWIARYNGPGNATDEVYSLVTDNSGNVYITGYSNGGSSHDDYCTIKYNANGVELWVKRYNGTDNNDDYGNSIVIDNFGNSYVTGASTTVNDLDYVTIKYDANGNQQWISTYNGPGNGIDFPSSNAIDAQGNIYIAGYSHVTNNNSDYCTIKLNNNGIQQWASRYNGPANGIDESFNVVLDNAGNVYVTGNSAGSGTGDDYCTIKYNNNGVQQWVARYNGNGTGNDYANWIAVDITGNVYITGMSRGTNQFDDIATIGYNPSGVQQWAVRYNGTGDEYDSGNALWVDNYGFVYVAGGSDSPNNTDYIIIKYSSTIGIKNISGEVPLGFKLYQNYPNPFNPVTKIKFSITSNVKRETSNVKMIIYDILGKEVETLVNEQLNPGTYEVEWDGTNYPSGVYFYKLIANVYSETKRMILIK